LRRLDPSLIYRLNLRVERVGEAILIHLGVGGIFALMNLLVRWRIRGKAL